MPRKPRFFQPGVVYHLISRFIDHEWFITHDRERAWYLELLGQSLVRTDWLCLSYGLMSSHIHLAVVAGREPLDSWIRRVHGSFADVINKTHGRIGCLFVRGPRDIRTPADRVADLLAYIHNNPVRAGVVHTAAQSSWTSHRAFLGLDPRPTWLAVDEALVRAGFSTAEELDAWARLDPDDPTRDERGRAVHDEDHEPVVDWSARAAPKPDATDVLEVVATVTRTSVACLKSRRRDRLHSEARRAAVHCADALGISGTAMAHALGISQQRVSAILVRRSDHTGTETLVESVMQRFEQK